MPNVIHSQQLVRARPAGRTILTKLFLAQTLATSYEGGLAGSEDNEVASDVNKEVLIGGDTENNR